MTILRPVYCVLAFSLLAGVGSAWAADDNPAPQTFDPRAVIAYQGDITLSQNEIDAAFSKLPESERLRFIRDGGKVDQLIRALLNRKVIAADAGREGYDQDPVVAALMGLEAEKALADNWLQKVVEDAPEADYEALAYEDYLANPDRYLSPETLDVSHILIGTEEHSGREAQELASNLRQQLLEDPSKFDDFVDEYSNDPAAAENDGRYPEMQRGMMVEPFEEAAFALKEPGDLSEPVQTEYGWHIIRLNARSGGERHEFEAVKEQAVAMARQRYLENYKGNYLRKVLRDPIVIPDESVEIMARRHFGENLEKAPN
jgi:peptidyl-prolyl cis-trans isomerase C